MQGKGSWDASSTEARGQAIEQSIDAAEKHTDLLLLAMEEQKPQYIGQYIEEYIEKRKYRKVYYMHFTLVETNMISDIQDKNEETNDDYNEMVTTNKQPITTSVDKKRLNKIVICPKCTKSMNRKTLTYSHDCQKSSNIYRVLRLQRNK